MSQPPLPFTSDKITTLSVDQLWELADPDLLGKAKEDRRVERKPAAIRPQELAEYFSMWANTATEGGVIAIGVANDGTMAGCRCIEIEHINKLESEAHTRCPDAHVQPKRILVKRTVDGADDFVLLLRVHYHPNRVVHTTSGEAFIRRGESKNRLTPHEIRDLQNDKGEVRVEQELYPSYKFPHDFKPALVRDFVTNVRANLTERHADEEVLAIRRLGELKSGTFVPNGACVLLFASDPLLIPRRASAFPSV